MSGSTVKSVFLYNIMSDSRVLQLFKQSCYYLMRQLLILELRWPSQKVWRSTPGEVCKELSQAKQLIRSERGRVLKWKVWWLDFYLAVSGVGSHHCGATAGIVCSKSLFLPHFQFLFWLVPYLILLTGRSLPPGVNLAAAILQFVYKEIKKFYPVLQAFHRRYRGPSKKDRLQIEPDED